MILLNIAKASEVQPDPPSPTAVGGFGCPNTSAGTINILSKIRLNKIFFVVIVLTNLRRFSVHSLDRCSDEHAMLGWTQILDLLNIVPLFIFSHNFYTAILFLSLVYHTYSAVKYFLQRIPQKLPLRNFAQGLSLGSISLHSYHPMHQSNQGPC